MRIVDSGSAKMGPAVSTERYCLKGILRRASFGKLNGASLKYRNQVTYLDINTAE